MTLSKIQGYLLNGGYATDPDATDTNATNSNATDCNATDPNATDPNATSADVYVPNYNYDYKLNNISIEKNILKRGQTVKVKINDGLKHVTGATLVFCKPDNSTCFYAYSTSNNLNLSISIPSYTIAGDYNLTNIYFYDEDYNYAYYTEGHSSYHGIETSIKLSVTVLDDIVTTINLNSPSENDIINAIQQVNDGGIINVSVNGESNYSASLFESLKGKDITINLINGDNSIAFYGKDINEAKNIKYSINVDEIAKRDNLKDLINSKAVTNGYVVIFPDNGTLPANAMVKIKVSNPDVIEEDEAFLYFYNTETKLYELESSNLAVNSEGYYEFTISHNSTFIIVGHALPYIFTGEVETTQKEQVTFQKSNTLLWFLIGGGAGVAVVIIVCAIYFTKKKKATNTTEEVKVEETKEEVKEETTETTEEPTEESTETPEDNKEE